MSVILETSIGDITVDLYTDQRPVCSRNFLKLCKIKYYNFTLFHSIQRNFIAQTGDPTGSGKGGESVFEKLYGEQARYFDAELKPRIKHTKLGTLSMVNNGNNMHGSQFFLTLGESLDYLDGEHTVFGEIAEGFETLTKLNETITDKSFRPYQDVRIFHTVVIDDPYPDPKGLESIIPDRSPVPSQEDLESARIGVGEAIDDYEGVAAEEVNKIMEEKEARANAELLEMVGDLPTADAEAPDTVLFVCKLNPVTTAEDLETIFSRFGDINSCEVIKDQKTGESLQYAFIEFSKPSECENAYFKMDNVLIDDRRIHVDFSQSVAKLKWQGKGKGVIDNRDEDRPKYKIKDRSRKDNYELLLDEDDEVAPSEKKHKKKKKKKKASSGSDSEAEERSRAKKYKEKPRRSRSGSRSPVERKSKHQRDDRYRDRQTDRYQDRQDNRYNDRQDNRYNDRQDNRYNDRQDNRYNDRQRDKYRDKYHHERSREHHGDRSRERETDRKKYRDRDRDRY